MARIAFRGDVGYLGRNGYGRTGALEVRDNGGTVSLQPVTKAKGVIARCEILVPRSEEILRELARVINAMADEIEGGYHVSM